MAFYVEMKVKCDVITATEDVRNTAIQLITLFEDTIDENYGHFDIIITEIRRLMFFLDCVLTIDDNEKANEMVQSIQALIKMAIDLCNEIKKLKEIIRIVRD